MFRPLVLASLAIAASAAEITSVTMPLDQMPPPVRAAVARFGAKTAASIARVVDRRILYTVTLYGSSRADDWYCDLEVTFDQDGKLESRRSLRRPGAPKLVAVEQHAHSRIERFSDGSAVGYYRPDGDERAEDEERPRSDELTAPSAPAASDPPTSAPPR
jgi:hypothetical protein